MTNTAAISHRTTTPGQPTAAFMGASWAALLLGIAAFMIGLYNATMELSLKGFFFTLMLYGLFSAVSLQKAVRDRLEGVAVTTIYFGLAWVSVLAVLVLLGVGMWQAPGLALSEKGFYAMAFALSLFSAVAVQKNVRDLELDEHAAGPVAQPGWNAGTPK